MRTKKPFDTIANNEEGVVLVTVLLLIAALSILGTTAVMQTSTDLRISTNYKTSRQAFYDADAGIQYAIAKMEAGLASDPPTFTLPSAGSPVSLTYTAPTGFSFTISSVSKNSGSDSYTFTSTGHGPGNAQVTIEVTVKGGSAISYAAFGNQKADMKNGGATLSYDSSSSDPTKNDPSDPLFQTTHEADVGSNDWLVTHTGSSIDGDGVLGQQSDGSTTVNDIHAETVFYGTAGLNAGRVDPDPLGINSGGEYDPSTYAAEDNNDNGDLALGTTIDTNGSVTLVGKAGGADYYFTSILLRNGANLTIDASAGPVNIFLEGGLSANNESAINVTGKPTDFSIFSNSTTLIDFKHSSTFKGFVYAPFANVNMKNSSSVYGAIWASQVDIKNSGTLYFDTALKDKFASNDLTLTAWKDVRN